MLVSLLVTWSWPELRHHPWRSATALLAVALGVALAFSVHLINASALSEFSAAVRSVSGQPDLSLRAQAQGFDEAVFERVSRDSRVAVASAVIEIDTRALPASGPSVPIRVIGLDALVAGPLAPELMPQPTDKAQRLAMLDPDAVFLNTAARAQLGLDDAAGRELILQAGPGRITLNVQGGIAAGGPPLAVMDIAGAQRHFGWQGRLSRIDLRLAPGASRDALLAGLALPPGVRASSPDEAAQRVSNLSRAYRVNLTVLALVALFTGAFLVFSILSLSVAKRQPQLALLGVLGLSARDRLALVLAESALLGVVGSVLGLLLGTALAATALRFLAGDLGGGYFTGVAPRLQFSAPAALIYGLLGIVAALIGGWFPARAAQRLAPAQALKGLGSLDSENGRAWIGPALIALGVALSFAPPIAELPLAAYVAVACLLMGGIACVPAGVAALLSASAPPRQVLALLAVQRARHQRQTATVAVAGVVASLALSVALTVMVGSFRESVDQWLAVVLPADLYVRSGGAANDTALDPGFIQSVSRLAGVTRVETLHVVPLVLDPARPTVALVARSIDDPAKSLPLVGDLAKPPVASSGMASVYVSEAVVTLYGARPGTTMKLPISRVEGLGLSAGSQAEAGSQNTSRPAGEGFRAGADATSQVGAGSGAEEPARPGDRAGATTTTVFVRGVWRDYARQFGAIAMDTADYRRFTGDTRVNDLSVWVAPDASAAAVEGRLRALAGESGLAGTAEISSAAGIRATSLRIFDRSFAVTSYLQTLAIALGLFGIAASFSAQVLARRKEFGLLSHLGLTRAQVLAVVAAEGAVWTAAGAAMGLLLGLAVSVVLVKVVNPQSFNWTMDLLVPWARLGVLCAAVVLAGTLTAFIAGRSAAGRDAALAVKEDW